MQSRRHRVKHFGVTFVFNPEDCFRFVIVSCCYVSFVYHIGLKAVSLHWALIVVSAVVPKREGQQPMTQDRM